MRITLSILGVVVLLILGFLYIYGVPRLFKTIYLIARVTPYEQKGTSDKKILVLGDSTGYGTGSADNKNSVAGRMGTEFPNYSIKNISVNGRTIGELKEALPDAIDNQNYDLILLQIGGNDILQKRDVSTVEQELKTVFTFTKSHSSNVVMMSSGNVGAAPAFSGAEAKQYTESTRQYRAMFIKLASENDVRYVDLFKEPEKDEFVIDPKTYTSIDGLHPTDAGYGIWYQTLSAVLKNLLTK